MVSGTPVKVRIYTTLANSRNRLRPYYKSPSTRCYMDIFVQCTNSSCPKAYGIYKLRSFSFTALYHTSSFPCKWQCRCISFDAAGSSSSNKWKFKATIAVIVFFMFAFHLIHIFIIFKLILSTMIAVNFVPCPFCLTKMMVPWWF